MTEEWEVRVWGVRGSVPVPDAEFLEYGGNTSCISVDCGGRLVVFDAGSGLIRLGNELVKSGRKRVDLLLGHLHVDHCLGLFGCKLLSEPDAEIHIYGRGENGAGLQKQLETLLGPPYWPLGLQNYPAHIEVHDVAPDSDFRLEKDENNPEELCVHTLSGKHPNGSLLYRLESGGKSIVHALDCEMDEEIFHRLHKFCRRASLLIWDANFTEKDLKRCRSWGHSSWEEGIALRRAAETETVLMTHYSSEYNDAFLRMQEKLAGQTDPASRFAKEGMKIKI